MNMWFNQADITLINKVLAYFICYTLTFRRQALVTTCLGSTTSTRGSLMATLRMQLMSNPYTFSHPVHTHTNINSLNTVIMWIHVSVFLLSVFHTLANLCSLYSCQAVSIQKKVAEKNKIEHLTLPGCCLSVYPVISRERQALLKIDSSLLHLLHCVWQPIIWAENTPSRPFSSSSPSVPHLHLALSKGQTLSLYDEKVNYASDAGRN